MSYISSGNQITTLLVSGETGFKIGDIIRRVNFAGVILSLSRSGRTVFVNQASAAGDTAVVAVEGEYEVAKAAPLEIVQGDAVFVAPAGGSVNKTALNRIFVGFATETAASAATTVKIKLAQTSVQITD